MEQPRKTWVLMKCGKSPVTMYATFEFSAGNWTLVSAAEISGGDSRSPQVEPLAGTFAVSDGYTGCAGCHATSVVCCGTCQELGCWNPADRRFRCGFCGTKSTVAGQIGQLKPTDWT